MKGWSNKGKLLIGIITFLSLMQCSNENSKVGDIYLAEKMFYKAGQIEKNILINPAIASPEEYENAEQIYRRLIQQLNDDKQQMPEVKNIVRTSWLALANLNLLRNNYDKAIGVYQEIISKATSDSDLRAIAQYSIGMSYEKLQRLDEAIAAYQRLVQEYPPVQGDSLLPNFTIMQTPIYISRLYRQQGKDAMADQQLEQARRYYQQVTARWPNSPIAVAAQDQLAASYGEQGQWSLAAEVMNDLIANYASQFELIDIIYRLAKVYEHQLNQAPRALEIYQEISNRYPRSRELGKVNVAIGSIYLSQKRYDLAREKFKYVLNNYSDDEASCLQAQMSIAKAYELENNWHKAVNEYQWVVENFPNTLPALDIPMYIARYYESQQEHELARIAYDKAIKQYTTTVEQYPNSMVAVVAAQNMADIFVKQAQWPQAVETLQRLLTMDLPMPDRVKAYLTLENIYEEKLNDQQKALEIYAELLQKYPQLPFAASLEMKSQELQRRLASYQQSNQPPALCDIIAAEVISSSAVRLQWQQNYDQDFKEYQLHRSESPNVDLSQPAVATIGFPQTVEYVDNNLKDGKTYYYRLYTFDRGGQATASREVAVTVARKQIGDAITLQANSKDWTSIELRWNAASTEDFDSYKIYRATTPGVGLGSQLVKSIFEQSVTQFEDRNLQENTRYYYKIYVFDAAGANKPSNEATATTMSNLPPQAIMLNRPLVIDNSTVELTWSPSADNDFSMYRIYRSERSPVAVNSPPIWINSNQTLTRYKDSGLKAGRTYYYKIVVYDAGGLFAESNEVAARL